MTRLRQTWIVAVAAAAALLPVAAVAAGVSFTTPSGLPSLPPLYGVTCPTATSCVAVGGGTTGAVVSTTDGGHTWTMLDVGGVAFLNSVSCFDATHCVAVGGTNGAARITHTSDGHTWTAVGSVSAAVTLTSVSCIATSRCLAVGSTFSGPNISSSALFSIDGGATWSTAATPTAQGQPALLSAVTCVSAQRCFVAGGGAWVTDTFGAAWRDIAPPSGCESTAAGFCAPAYSLLVGLDFTDATHGAVGGGVQCGGQGVTMCLGAYFTTADAGASWTKSPSTGQSTFAFVETVACMGGRCLANSDAFTHSSILMTSGAAAFAPVGSSPGNLNAIACAPGGGPCIDVGSNGSTGVLLQSAVGIGAGTAAKLGGGAAAGGGGASNSLASSFSTSLPTPAAVSSSASTLVWSALLVLALVLLVVFPSQLFNRTYEENHARIRTWWVRRVPWMREGHQPTQPRALRGAVALAAAVVVGAVLGTLLDPKVGLNARSAALFTGIVVAFLFSMALGAAVTAAYRLSRHRATQWQLHALPSGLVVAAVCVLVSRVVNFQPGYLYGIIGGIAFAGALSGKEQGHLVALSSAVTLGVAVLAWLLWVPVSAAAARPGAGFGMALLSNVLSALFVGGLAGVVLSLIPLRFLPGEKLAAWHWGAWAAVFGLAMFGLVQIMLRPQSAAAHVASVPLWTTVGLFVAFGTASLAFWAYFRSTAAHDAVAEAPPPG